MVYRTMEEAAGYAARRMAENRETSITVRMLAEITAASDFIDQIYLAEPKLAACIGSIWMRVKNFRTWTELSLTVGYTEVMLSAVTVYSGEGQLQRAMLDAVRLHRRDMELVFEKEQEERIRAIAVHATKHHEFLNCFLTGIGIGIRNKEGNRYGSMKISFGYLCSYPDMCIRRRQTEEAVERIAAICRRAGTEDWRKAFACVKYCVEQWEYGKVEDRMGLEYTAYGAIVYKKAVCMGISLAICAIFSRLGIPCRYVQGVRNQVKHAWNLVFIRGGWFCIDVTDAIGKRDPYYHWGMTSFDDRIMTTECGERLCCNCDGAYIRNRWGSQRRTGT